MLLHARRSTTSRIQKPDARPDELLEVLVARDDDHIETRADRLPCESADDVVSLVAPNGNDGNAISLEQLTDALHPPIEIGLQFVGQLLTGCLVACVCLVPKGKT